MVFIILRGCLPFSNTNARMVRMVHTMVETTRMYNPLHNRGQRHACDRSSKRSYLATTTNDGLFDQEPSHPYHANLALRLTEHNTPCVESSLSCEDEEHRGEVSSYLGALHQQKAQNPKDQHRGEHRRLLD